MIWKSEKTSLSTWSNINGIVFWWTEKQELWFENDVWWFPPFSSFISRAKYWGHIQVLVTTRRLITLNNWPLRRSMLALSSRCWPRRDHPMLMSAPGSYYCPLPTRAYLQYNFKAIPSSHPIHPKSEKVCRICFSGPKRLQKKLQKILTTKFSAKGA